VGRREFIVEVSLPGPTHTLPGHPLIQCEATATRLNGWSWEVGGQSTKGGAFTTAMSCNGECYVECQGQGILLSRPVFTSNIVIG